MNVVCTETNYQGPFVPVRLLAVCLREIVVQPKLLKAISLSFLRVKCSLKFEFAPVNNYVWVFVSSVVKDENGRAGFCLCSIRLKLLYHLVQSKEPRNLRVAVQYSDHFGLGVITTGAVSASYSAVVQFKEVIPSLFNSTLSQYKRGLLC